MAFMSVLDVIENQVEVSMEECLKILETEVIDNIDMENNKVVQLLANQSDLAHERKIVSNRDFGEYS